MKPPTPQDSSPQSTGLALAHWDDDGAPALGTDRGATESRFCLEPLLGRGDIDGAWWPRSLDVEVELAALLTAMLPLVGRARSVALHRDAWPSRPPQLQITGHRVLLGWFTHIDPTAITISGASHEPLRLRLIPFDTPQPIAVAVMRSAACGGESRPQPSDSLLQQSSEHDEPGLGWRRHLRAVKGAQPAAADLAGERRITTG
jgi:Family of unknown function (DUF5994)